MIRATCPNCSNQLNVNDDLVGKQIKCPKCKSMFMAMAIPSRRVAEEKVPRIHLSPGAIVFLILLIGFPSVFAFWRHGPGKVARDWAALEPSATEDVKDVVDRGLQAYLSQHGSYDASRSISIPKTLDVTFVFGPMHMSMPEVIGFAGTSTEGAMVGRYHPGTHEIEVDVEIGGMALPGAGALRRGDTKVHVTGRVRDKQISAEIDGKDAVIYTPPPRRD